MMDFQFINLKIAAEQQTPPAFDRFVRTFHSWIQKDALDDLLIDVADYSHVPAGPGILLVAHEAIYSVEYGPEEHFGLLYNNRQKQGGSNQEKLHRALQKALTAANLLQQAEQLAGGISFTPGLLTFTINRRQLAANTTETLEYALPDLQAVFDVYFGAGNYRISLVETDPRARFTISVESENAPDVSGMLARNAAYWQAKN